MRKRNQKLNIKRLQNRISLSTKQDEHQLRFQSISTPTNSEEYLIYHRNQLPFYLSQSFRNRISYNQFILKPLNQNSIPLNDRLIKRNSKMLDKSLLKLDNGSDESFSCCGKPEELMFERELDIEISQLASSTSKSTQNEADKKQLKKEIPIANFYQIPNKSLILKPKDNTSNSSFITQEEETLESFNKNSFHDDESIKPIDDSIFWESLKIRNQKEELRRKNQKERFKNQSLDSDSMKCESPTDMEEKIKSPRPSEILYITQSNSPDQMILPTYQTEFISTLTNSTTTESISSSTKSSLNPIPESPSPPRSPITNSQSNLEKPKRNGIIVVGGLSIRNQTLISFEKDELSEKDSDGKLIRRVSLPSTSPDSNLDEKTLKAKRKALCFRSH